jgi:predicted dehydrogenase
MVGAGQLGDIQAVRVNYIQGGLRSQTPGKKPPRGAWKADPALAGPAGTLADIGTHAFHMLRYVTGLLPAEVSCQLKSFFPGRLLDDYGHVVLRLKSGGLGTITVSQVTHGRLNDLTLEVDGTTGSLRWCQERPDQLTIRRFGKPVETLERNPRAPWMNADLRRLCRLPGGHPEGPIEAFANIYSESFDHMVARAVGQPVDAAGANYPTVTDGLEGMLFVEQCLASHRNNGSWQPFDT